MASNAGAPPSNHDPTIVDLPGLANRLEGDDRERFSRLIRVTEATGHLRAPSSMHEWITRLFGSVQAVEEQTIVKTTNLVTMEGTSLRLKIMDGTGVAHFERTFSGQ